MLLFDAVGILVEVGVGGGFFVILESGVPLGVGYSVVHFFFGGNFDELGLERCGVLGYRSRSMGLRREGDERRCLRVWVLVHYIWDLGVSDIY